ncbi:sensor histidine kinase [Nocardioides dongxiaopingii]|uniref:sensor histidine kinase n=1 Tax=Nocardioides dongxiaopingii TaxID=2576036 RepID=UPI001FEACF14|nr:HAMP domain-containing sensor histidine kinase [Nocardioides dongxiaopingii]
MRDRFASLTARLVGTAVALVVLVSVFVGGATALAMRAYLTHQLDQDVADSSQRALGPGGDGPGFGDPGGRPAPRLGTEVGTVTAELEEGRAPQALVLSERSGASWTAEVAVGDDVVDVLADVPADGRVRGVDLPSLGAYRVVAIDLGDKVVVTGLPADEVGDAVRTLVLGEVVLIVVGGVLALAGSLLLVRRQLRPLREVAETAHTVAALPLESGEIGVTERVPAHLTDERTEVGQVGAALNTLLAHVEGSLDARHASEQRVRQFVADASHELRTPLTTIAGYTELARRRPDDTAVAATALTKVADESKRMTALVEDLLLLARLDSGRPLRRDPVDLTRLLLEAVADARVVGPEHHWRLDLPDEAVEVEGDADRLHQVLTNLLTNARRYTPAGTTVTVTARRGGFSVHDDGPGFDPEVLPHAFERFARADVSRHREGGVGLGLALVEAIVTAHGGTVRLTSAPGDTLVDVRLD